jgi:hypothetical protein
VSPPSIFSRAAQEEMNEKERDEEERDAVKTEIKEKTTGEGRR